MPTLAEQIRQLSTGQPIEQPIDISQNPTEVIQSITSQLPQNWSVRDLERNRTFLAISDRFLNAIGEDDDIFETLRDSDWNLTRALGRAYNSRRWDEQTQKDYQVLRSVWDQTQLEGAGEWLEAIKDVGVDIITDPIGWVGSPFLGRAVTTGIRGARATRIAERMATTAPKGPLTVSPKGTVFRDDIQRAITTINNARRGSDNLIGAGVTGAFDGAIYDIATQLTEKHADMRDTVNVARTLGFAGAGATFGSGLALIGNRGFKKANRRFNDERSQEVINTEQVAKDEVEKITKLDTFREKWLSSFIGRSTSAKARFAKISPLFADLLKKIRPDALEGIAQGTKQLQEAINIPYFIEKKEIIGQHLNRVRTAINNIKTDSKNVSFWERMFKHRLTEEQEINLANLSEMPVKDLMRLKSYVRKNGFVINDVIGKIPTDSKSAKAKELKDFFDRLKNDYGVDFNYRYTEDLVDASIEIQKSFRELGKLGYTEKLFSPGVYIHEAGRGYFPRYWKDKEFLALPENREVLQGLLIKWGHADPLDTKAKSVEAVLKRAGITKIPTKKGVTSQKTNESISDYLNRLEEKDKLNIEIKIPDPDDIDSFVTYTIDDLERLETLDFEVFGERHLKGYASFTDKARKTLGKNKTEQEILEEAQRLKSIAIVDDMVKISDGPSVHDSSKAFPVDQFLKTRVFRDIPNHELRAAGLIQTRDISKQINGYIQGMGSAIVDERYFGRTLRDFDERFITPILTELKQANVSQKDIDEMSSYLKNLYEDITGKRKSTANTFFGKAYEGTLVAQSLAHLPLAVISSITEPLLLIARADLADVPAAAKITARLLKAQIKKTFDNVQVLAKKARGKETKGYTTLREQLKKDPEFAEDFFDGLSQIEEASYRFVNFEADDLKQPWARTVTDLFFKVNFLNGWTQTVRAAAFGIAKSKIRRITKELAEGQTSSGKKLSAKQIAKKREELFEIGIDVNRSISTYNNSLDPDGSFNLQKWQKSKFYQEEVNISSSMFANEIILNADASEASKPLWMNSPAGRLLFQFASYPTAFNNVVLRRLARATIKDPTINAPKALAMATIMTSVAVLGNTARSLGQNLKDQDAEEIIGRGFQRTGFLAQLDYLVRYNDAKRYNPTLPTRLMSTFGGPAVQDLTAVSRGTVTMSDLLINNLPGIGVVPAEVRREWRVGARENIERYTEEPGPMVFAKGGVVTNVPNVSPEPDEMKIRGLPYTYQQVAGGVMKETEDRLGFQEGGMVADDDFMQVYQYLTKDEKYYESDDTTPLFMYEKNEIPNPTVKKEMYISLPENSYQALFYECREGQEVGLPVYDSQMKTDKPFRFKGYVKFSNPLELNIDNTSPEEISRELENIDLDKAYLGKKQSERMIKEIKFQLSLRDDMLSKDPRKSRAKEERMRESKCFIIRDRLLRMGFDAIKFNNGYALLKQNQFFPTEESKIGFKKGGLVDRMRKRKGYAEGGEAKTQLYKDIMNYVTRATGKEEKEFFKTHPYYGELKDNKAYVNEDLLRERGSTGNFAQDMVLGEALHKLSESAPEWYNRLYQAAENDKDVQEWKQESYKYAKESGEDQGRSIDDWWRESRFDQVVGGFILGGENANVNTMREWNRDRLPYGTTFRKELEDFEDALGYRRGYAEGGFVSSLLNYIVTARNLRDSRPLESYADAVAWQESRGRGPQTVQDNNGPARGKYQVEGSQGSQRNDTILQRAINFYDKYPDAPTSDEIQYALSQRGQDLDFSTLSEETQDALFYMDAERGRLPINDLYSGTLSNRDAWITYWNQDPNISDPEVRRRREEDWERAIQERTRNN